MLDIDDIRDNTDQIEENLQRRDFDVSLIDEVLELDRKWREEKQRGDELRMKRNNITDRIEEKKGLEMMRKLKN